RRPSPGTLQDASRDRGRGGAHGLGPALRSDRARAPAEGAGSMKPPRRRWRGAMGGGPPLVGGGGRPPCRRVLQHAPAIVTSTPTPMVPRARTDRLVAAGQPTFWAGLNYPWKTGQDFGTGGWGHSGVSDATTYQEIDADFANMAAQGVRVVKWRVFSDGRYGLQFDADGNVVGLDAYFFPDLDAAREIAQRHDLYLVLTLFSSGFWTANCQSNNVQLGGHADIVQDPVKRQSLLDQAIVPMLDHVASSDRIL